jgi:hypothetical protein
MPRVDYKSEAIAKPGGGARLGAGAFEQIVQRLNERSSRAVVQAASGGSCRDLPRVCELAPDLIRPTPVKRHGRNRASRQRGAVIFEWLEILLLVTFGACVALAPLAKYLLAYFDRIETLTGLPLP